ncbi:diguanylate cyclase [Marinomonas arenicola]|uniref:diguanylate cyclase n=1 Tax=Marinomonas arenicola TaxID=569601 RepID=A0ABU9G1S0_9GAMM
MSTKFDDSVYRSIVENSIDAVVIINRSGDIVSWNSAAEQIFGYTASEAIGKYVHDILPAHDLRDKANKSFQKFKKKGSGPLVGKVLQVRGLKKNGDEVHVQFSFNTAVVNGELFAFAFIRDISELIDLQEKLIFQATVDPLTNLLNRRAFLQQTEAAFNMSKRHKEPLSLLMIDFDFFKEINDQYGHHVGDIVLKEFSSKTSKLLRTEDIIGRIGGEEFVIALTKTPIEYSLKLAERIRVSTENINIKTPGLSVSFTVSIGVSCIENNDESLQQLLERSDKAMYKAKKEKNCVVSISS